MLKNQVGSVTPCRSNFTVFFQAASGLVQDGAAVRRAAVLLGGKASNMV
jgi:hypothetical protein